jgi:cell wall-associated NlpC family hydrolase
MKKVKLSDFIDYLEKQVGQPYLWGGQHTKLTPYTYIDIIERKETSAQNAEDAIAYCKNLFDNGASVLYAYDCSGLGMYYLQNVTKTYSHDMSANGMMGECEKADEPKKGYWVFRLNGGKATHIGYMVSDTEVIHAKGRKYGVVNEKWKKSYWHCTGIPKCIDFEPEPPEPEPPKPTPTIKIKFKGSVRVREGNGVLTKKIKTVRNCLCRTAVRQSSLRTGT